LSANGNTRAMPVLAFSENPWEATTGSTVQSLLPRLASRGWPVLHSNGALSVWQRGSADWSQAGLASRLEVIGGVQVERTGKLYLRWPKFPAWDALVVRRHAAWLRSRIARRDEPAIAIAYHPRFYSYVRSLRERFSTPFVFHSIDNYLDQPGATAELKAMLERCVTEADLLIANNPSGAARLPGPGPRKARLLPSGVDLPVALAGLGQPCPADLSAVPHPRIGYVGRLNPKLDFAAIAATASRHPDWHWVLIGDAVMDPANSFYPGVANAWETCRQLPNIHFLGPKPFREVSTYLEHMDVNTICYRLDAGAWTTAAYPFKIHECLAAGRAVVCAAMPEVRRRHADVIDFATTPEEWDAAIGRALQTGGVGTPAQRQAVAAQNSSDHRADQLEDWLRELAARTPPRPS
jgi:glycosyltransferase involved in cell wall biosynthesis